MRLHYYEGVDRNSGFGESMADVEWVWRDTSRRPIVVGAAVSLAAIVGIPYLTVGEDIDALAQLGASVMPIWSGNAWSAYLSWALLPYVLLLANVTIARARVVRWASVVAALWAWAWTIQSISPSAQPGTDGSTMARLTSLGIEATYHYAELYSAMFMAATFAFCAYWMTRLWCRLLATEGDLASAKSDLFFARNSKPVIDLTSISSAIRGPLEDKIDAIESRARAAESRCEGLELDLARARAEAERARRSTPSAWEISPERREALRYVMRKNDASNRLWSDTMVDQAIDFALDNRLGRGSLARKSGSLEAPAKARGLDPKLVTTADEACDLTNLISTAVFEGDSIVLLADAYKTLPFDSKGEMMTPAEWHFWSECLSPVSRDLDLVVVPKPPLREFVSVDDGVRRAERAQAQSMLGGKNVDFVLCRKRSLRIACIIELDDTSHLRDGSGSLRTVRSDEIKNMVLEKVGIPIVRQAGKARGETWTDADRAALKARIAESLGSASTSDGKASA